MKEGNRWKQLVFLRTSAYAGTADRGGLTLQLRKR